ncbi:MAG: hypothetical protein ABJB61_00845 [bacterium]
MKFGETNQAKQGVACVVVFATSRAKQIKRVGQQHGGQAIQISIEARNDKDPFCSFLKANSSPFRRGLQLRP